MGDACLSPATVALFVAILAPIMTGFGILYRDMLKGRDARIEDLGLRLTEATTRLQAGSALMDEAETVLQQRARKTRR